MLRAEDGASLVFKDKPQALKRHNSSKDMCDMLDDFIADKISLRIDTSLVKAPSKVSVKQNDS